MSGHLMDAPRCKAMAKQTGRRCKRRPIPGGTVCVIHGGASPAARAAAAQRLAEAEATKLLELIWDPHAAPVTSPVEALQALAGKLKHAADVLGARVSVEDLDGPTALAWSRVVSQFRLSLEGMERLDLAGKHVELEQGRALMVTTALQAALDALALSPGERSRAMGTFLQALTVAVGRGGDFVLSSPAAAPLAHDVSVLLAQVVRAVLDRLDLSDQQWATARVVVPEELRRMGETSETVVGELE